MKTLKFAVIATFALCCAYAMPTTQEITATRPLVSELMAPVMAEYKAKTKTATEVANTAIGFAGSAKSEAACYLFLRGAVSNIDDKILCLSYLVNFIDNNKIKLISITKTINKIKTK